MNKRPWPIIWMAILQFISPLLYIGIAALFYQLSPMAAANEILALTPELRKFEIFVLPVFLGILILLTKKPGYYVVIVGSLYLMTRGVMEFFASNETDPVFPLVLTNLVCLVVLITLLRSKTRSVYFDPRLRWWETSPRYIVGFPATITRVGAKPMKVTMDNIAAGGAGFISAEAGFLKNEIVNLEFQNDSEAYTLKTKIVWEKAQGNGKQYLGAQWDESNSPSDWASLRRLIRTLKSRRTPTTRSQESLLSGVKDWFAKLAG